MLAKLSLVFEFLTHSDLCVIIAVEVGCTQEAIELLIRPVREALLSNERIADVIQYQVVCMDGPEFSPINIKATIKNFPCNYTHVNVFRLDLSSVKQIRS